MNVHPQRERSRGRSGGGGGLPIYESARHPPVGLADSNLAIGQAVRVGQLTGRERTASPPEDGEEVAVRVRHLKFDSGPVSVYVANVGGAAVKLRGRQQVYGHIARPHLTKPVSGQAGQDGRAPQGSFRVQPGQASLRLKVHSTSAASVSQKSLMLKLRVRSAIAAYSTITETQVRTSLPPLRLSRLVTRYSYCTPLAADKSPEPVDAPCRLGWQAGAGRPRHMRQLSVPV